MHMNSNIHNEFPAPFDFFFQKFFESCSESSETWKKLKKKIFVFSLFWVRLGESTPKVLGILNH